MRDISGWMNVLAGSPETRRVDECRRQSIGIAGCRCDVTIGEPVEAPVGPTRHLARQLSEQATRRFAAWRHAGHQVQEDRRVAGRRQAGHQRIGQERAQLVRRRHIAEPRRGSVDVVELAATDRVDQVPRCVAEALTGCVDIEAAGFADSLTEGLEAVTQLVQSMPRLVAPVSGDVCHQCRSREELERRVQHERVGLFDTRHREAIGDVTDQPGIAGADGYGARTAAGKVDSVITTRSVEPQVDVRSRVILRRRTMTECRTTSTTTPDR